LTDHPVVDMTGLTGKYEMGVEVSMREMMNAARAAGANVPARPWIRTSPRIAASDPGGSSLRQYKHWD